MVLGAWQQCSLQHWQQAAWHQCILQPMAKGCMVHYTNASWGQWLQAACCMTPMLLVQVVAWCMLNCTSVSCCQCCRLHDNNASCSQNACCMAPMPLDANCWRWHAAWCMSSMPLAATFCMVHDTNASCGQWLKAAYCMKPMLLTDSCCMAPTNASFYQLLHGTRQSLLQQIAANASCFITQVSFNANTAGCRLHAAPLKFNFMKPWKLLPA